MPLSLRPKPKHPLDFTFNNKFAILPLRLTIVDDFKEGFNIMRDDMDKLKRSMTPFAMMYMHKAIMNFPAMIREWIINDYTKRVTFGFEFIKSNSVPSTITGSKTKS